MSSPSTKHTDNSSPSFLWRDRPEPICVPIGVIARSAPRLNRPMPSTSATAPMVNVTSSVCEKSNSGVSAIR